MQQLRDRGVNLDGLAVLKGKESFFWRVGTTTT